MIEELKKKMDKISEEYTKLKSIPKPKKVNYIVMVFRHKNKKMKRKRKRKKINHRIVNKKMFNKNQEIMIM